MFSVNVLNNFMKICFFTLSGSYVPSAGSMQVNKRFA